MCTSILHIDDDANDQWALRNAAAHLSLRSNIVSIASPTEAQRYLLGSPPYDDRNKHPIPILIVLDVRMPEMSGLELLAWIRSHKQFDGIAVVMLTGESGIKYPRDLGVIAFLQKPPSREKWRPIIELLDKLSHNISNVHLC